MDIQKLKYFYTTAQIEHVTRAAEILHVAQPSLTQAIHALEEELEVPLFTRQNRRIELTEYGRFLKSRLDTLLPAFDGLAGELEQLKNTVNKTVKLNILAASTLVINTIVAYKKQNEDVVFDFAQNEQRTDCDIIITTNGAASELPKKPLQRTVKAENIYLAVPLNSAYATKESLDLREVSEESFIMLSGSRLFGGICRQFCSMAGFHPKILFESDSPSAVQNIIAMGAGIAFWPEHSWGKVNNENVTLIPISSPICQRDLIIQLNERHPVSAYSEDFYNFLVQNI